MTTLPSSSSSKHSFESSHFLLDIKQIYPRAIARVLLAMPSVKRAAMTASPARASPRTKRTKAKAESPPASRGEELEIGHAPEPFYLSTPITPRSKRIKTEPMTPITPAKVDELATAESASKMSPAKLRMLESLSSSPFPDFAHPTPDECHEVNAALVKVHGKRVRPKELNLNALGANCGEVPSVLDALVRTILSQNTNNKNSSTAKHSLDETFGVGNYEAVRVAPLEEVVDALRCGGLANIKGGRIKRILNEVYEKYGTLSLDHLHGVSDEEAKRELMAFDGVGPKTASCVLLFCLRRESFAVDTHVVSHLSCF
jgi:endonuclease III